MNAIQLIHGYRPSKKMHMLTLFLSSIMITICFATLSTIGATSNQISAPTADVNRTINGPYRDGLYLGSLAANHRQAFHISAGRWAIQKDREAFSEGYRLAFEAATVQDFQKQVK
jgi:hypothetical protein